jgi:hypothetical protein
VWEESQYTFGGTPRFFRISLRDENLRNYYLTNFSLMQYHHYSLTELEDMIPWERKTYVGLVAKHVQEENQRIQAEKEKLAAAQKRR